MRQVLMGQERYAKVRLDAMQQLALPRVATRGTPVIGGMFRNAAKALLVAAQSQDTSEAMLRTEALAPLWALSNKYHGSLRVAAAAAGADGIDRLVFCKLFQPDGVTPNLGTVAKGSRSPRSARADGPGDEYLFVNVFRGRCTPDCVCQLEEAQALPSTHVMAKSDFFFPSSQRGARPRPVQVFPDSGSLYFAATRPGLAPPSDLLDVALKSFGVSPNFFINAAISCWAAPISSRRAASASDCSFAIWS